MADEFEEEFEGGEGAEGEGEGEGKKKSKLKLIIILVVALLVLGGGGFAAYKFFLAPKDPAVVEEGKGGPTTAAEGEAGQAAKGKEGEGKKGEAAAKSITYPLDPFIVNLADPVGNRYLKVRLALDLSSAALQTEVENRVPLLRDSILLLLSSKTFAEINSMEGKLKLRGEILHRINQALKTGKVTTIYFTEFVVQ